MLPKNATVRQLLDENKGNAPGFDALRIVFCVVIVLWHAYCLSLGARVIDKGLMFVILRGILPMFFFLAGFLVTGSALRLKSVKSFFIFRVFRIFPALVTEVFLSAVILGGLITTLPLAEYYSHPGFAAYFLNIVGVVRFLLPGVFESNPLPYVNYNLWTLPGEFYCYIGMFVLLATRAIFHRRVVLVLLSVAILFFTERFFLWTETAGPAQNTIVVYSWFLPCSFMIGVLAYLFADKIVLNRGFLLLSLAAFAGFLWDSTMPVGVLGACYLCLYAGFADLRRFALAKHGDFSYGIYLYGYPIQQALVYFFPVLKNPWLLGMASLPVSIGFAMLSWRFIEKPVLGLRRHFGTTRQV